MNPPPPPRNAPSRFFPERDVSGLSRLESCWYCWSLVLQPVRVRMMAQVVETEFDVGLWGSPTRWGHGNGWTTDARVVLQCVGQCKSGT